MNNKVIISGNVGATPAIRVTPNNNLVANMDIAIHEDYTDKAGQPARKVVWTRVVAWNDVATKIADHVNKGDFLSIRGKLSTREYEQIMEVKVSPKKTIQVPIKRYVTEIHAFEVVKL